jgi:general secretion pathway protein J
MRQCNQQSSGGFTLIELLLAVALSAVVAVLAYAGISNGSAAATRAAMEVQRLTDLQRAFTVLEEDLLQLRLRSVQLGFGERESAFVSSGKSAQLLEFTRGGVANPLAATRSDLQRVRYQWRDGALWRQHWQHLERVNSQQAPQEVLVLPTVTAIKLEFLVAPPPTTLLDVNTLISSGYWESRWDSEDPLRALAQPLPLAVRITVELPELGQVQRVYAL